MPKDEGSPDLVIISMHEKGFPQADIYLSAATMDPDEFRCCAMPPDGFFTMKRGQTLEDAKAHASTKWPDAKIVEAETYDEDHEE